MRLSGQSDSGELVGTSPHPRDGGGARPRTGVAQLLAVIAGLATTLLGVIVGLATTLLGVTPAQALSDGAAVPDGSLRFVVKVNVGDARACTGALIDPQWILTAASCFSVGGQPVRAGAPQLPATATVGRADLSASAGPALPVAEVYPSPDRNLALARIPLRVGDVTPVPLADSAPAAGEAVSVAGYGRTASEWVPGQLHAEPATVAAVTAGSFTWTGADQGATACKGDAGGPVFRMTGGQPQLVGLDIASWQGRCLAESDTRAGATAVRLDDVRSWIAQHTPGLKPDFSPYYQSSNDVGTYDLASTADRVIPFDYDHSGKQDHLVLYRPGSGIIFIVKHNPDGTYTPVVKSLNGISGFSLRVASDRIVPFDYDHSGKLDHLLLYRPGAKTVFILEHGAGSTFSTVYSSSTAGIGGFDLAGSLDQVVPFDYDHSGKQDYLALYRPGSGIIHLVKHGAGATFTAVFKSSAGISGFSLRVTSDRIVPFDYDHSGKLDHLLLYRPGARTVFILRHGAGATFSTVYSNSTAGIGGYDLASTGDQVIAYDYEHTGKQDHLVLYRPGSKTVGVLAHGAGSTFTPVYFSNTAGIGGYNLASVQDKIIAFDGDHAYSAGYLMLYRPGSRTAWVVGRPPGAQPGTSPVWSSPDTADSIVEDFAYPGAAAILASLNVRLISGDGHIVLADCATPPVDNVSVIKVWTTEQVGSDGAGLVCFKVNASAGRLDLDVPGVYEIRGDGQLSGYGHKLTAVVKTPTGSPTPVVVNPSGSTQVGIGVDPNAEPTTLLQLRVPA